MRILLADRLEAETVEALTERGHECVVEPSLSADELPARIPGFGALVVRSTRKEVGVKLAGSRR